MHKILSKRVMAQGTVVENVISASKIARKARPGQFVIVRVNETGERIPMTMADTDLDKGSITIVYQVVGKTTALLKALQVGDVIQDIAGPLGKATHIEKIGTVVCVGGGTGIASLFELAALCFELVIVEFPRHGYRFTNGDHDFREWLRNEMVVPRRCSPTPPRRPYRPAESFRRKAATSAAPSPAPAASPMALIYTLKCGWETTTTPLRAIPCCGFTPIPSMAPWRGRYHGPAAS